MVVIYIHLQHAHRPSTNRHLRFHTNTTAHTLEHTVASQTGPKIERGIIRRSACEQRANERDARALIKVRAVARSVGRRDRRTAPAVHNQSRCASAPSGAKRALITLCNCVGCGECQEFPGARCSRKTSPARHPLDAHLFALRMRNIHPSTLSVFVCVARRSLTHRFRE